MLADLMRRGAVEVALPTAPRLVTLRYLGSAERVLERPGNTFTVRAPRRYGVVVVE